MQLILPYPSYRDFQKRNKDWYESVQLSFGSLARADSVSVTAIRPQDIELLNRANDVAARVLKRLKVSAQGSARDAILELLPPSSLPCLRTLELSGVRFRWPLVLPASMVHLYLDNARTSMERPSIVQLFDTLRCVPQLESLKIYFMLPEQQPLAPGMPSAQEILLSKLRVLHVVDQGTFCASFLQRLSFPDTCSLTSHSACTITTDELARETLQDIVLQHYQKGRDYRRCLGLLSCVDVMLDYGAISFDETWFDKSLADTTHDIVWNESGLQSRVSFFIQLGSADLYACRYSIFEKLVWDDVQRFQVSGRWVCDDIIVPVSLRGVDTARATEHTSEALLRALYHSKIDRDADEVDLFPALRTLILSCVWFNNGENARFLLDILHSRASGVRKIVLRSCANVPPEVFDTVGLHVVQEDIDEPELETYVLSLESSVYNFNNCNFPFSQDV